MSEPIVDGGADPKTNGGAGSGEDKDKAFLALKAEKKALADEAAKLKLELGKIQEEKRLKEEESLKQSGEYKKLYEKVEQEKKELAERVAENERQKLNLRKIDVVMKEIGPLQKPEYFNFLDLDRIPVDSTTGDVDIHVAKQVASDFVKVYPELVKKKTTSLPSDAARPSESKALTMEEWSKLGSSKEMKERYKDIVKNRNK